MELTSPAKGRDFTLHMDKNMALTKHLCVKYDSDVGEARRLASALCRDLDFDELRIGQAALMVTELATNLARHTHGVGGELVFSPVQQAGETGIDLLSLDQGPGIDNISLCLRDGHSTAGTLGKGLGRIQQLSSVFDISSIPGQGTVLFSRLWKKLPPPSAFTVGGVCLPVNGEQACGDAWAMKQGPDSMLFMLADGLGHGPDAAAASELAVTTFKNNTSCNPENLVQLIHSALHGTRGAAVAVAEVSPQERLVRYVGVGNISGLMLTQETTKHLVSLHGTAGGDVRKTQTFTYPWSDETLLVLHSDGLATHWSLKNYPGLAFKHPALIAGVLFRNHQRLRDDSTVVVIKTSGSMS